MDDDIDPQPGDSEDVARLLRVAGRRPWLPESEVGPLRAEAREVFRRQAREAGRSHLVWTMTAAAGLAAVLLLVAGLMYRPPAGSRSDVPVAQIERRTGEVTLSRSVLLPGTLITTAEGGRVALRLPTGASVRIDGGSSVRFDSAHSLTLERGALYADSESSADHEGIEIATPLGSVHDIGTQFEVRLLPEGLRVRVREGTVRVGYGGKLLEAGAGSELLVQEDGSARSADVPVYGPGWDWVQRAAPPFTIENASLAEFLHWVSRETGLRWHLAEPGDDPEKVILHGSIEGLTAEEALSVVLPGSGYRHRLAGGEIRLEKAAP